MFPLYFFVDLSGLNFLNFGICIRLWWQALILKSLKFSAAAAFSKWLDRLDKFFFRFLWDFKFFFALPRKICNLLPTGLQGFEPTAKTSLCQFQRIVKNLPNFKIRIYFIKKWQILSHFDPFLIYFFKIVIKSNTYLTNIFKNLTQLL